MIPTCLAIGPEISVKPLAISGVNNLLGGIFLRKRRSRPRRSECARPLMFPKIFAIA
jgi:hypothetical protein